MTKLRGTFAFAGFFFLAGLGAAGCGGGGSKATAKCVLESDCSKDTLKCVQGFCVPQCNTSADCARGERCIFTASGHTCQPPEKKTCALNSDCSPLFCAADLVCRNECVQDIDCPGGGLPNGQKCTSMSHRCVDPVLDQKSYDPATNELIAAPGRDGGAAGKDGSAMGSDGAAGSDAAAASDGDAASDRAPVNTCPSPQTTFGATAEGDSNPGFTSGVGVRTATQLLVFSGYAGPTPSNFDGGVGDGGGGADAAIPTGNFIFVQAFDALTGVSAGPATPLLKAEDGNPFVVSDVSIAPTGEIVLLHSSNQLHGTGHNDSLFATFFAAPTAGAASPDAAPPSAAPRVVRTVRLESIPMGVPHVIWSVPSQAFVVSWKYFATDFFIRVKAYLPGGTPAGAGTAAVPVPGKLNDVTQDDSQVGVSGDLLATVTRNAADGHPYLTVMDGDGNRVGGFLSLGPDSSPWMAVAGTASGFVALYKTGGAANEVFVSTAVATADGGAPDGGMAALPGFSFATTASFAKAINDDTGGMGGMGGVGVVLLETNGAGFVYIRADGTSRQLVGTVISQAGGVQAAITNFKGSMSVSLYNAAKHSTQVVASGCLLP